MQVEVQELAKVERYGIRTKGSRRHFPPVMFSLSFRYPGEPRRVSLYTLIPEPVCCVGPPLAGTPAAGPPLPLCGNHFARRDVPGGNA